MMKLTAVNHITNLKSKDMKFYSKIYGEFRLSL